MSASRFTKKPDLSFAKDLGKNLADFNFGRLAEDIMGLFMDARSQGSSRIRGELEKILGRLELVTRREFEAVREIAIAARTQAEELADHVGMAKKKPAAKKAAAKKTPVKKTAAKKPAAKKTARKR